MPHKTVQDRKEYARQYYLKNRDRLLERSKSCTKQHNIRAREKWHSVRLRIIDQLGNKCVRCGFNDIRALQIDHIYGGGTKHRHTLSSGSFYRSILEDLEMKLKYQCLCANCNWIKRYENKEAPTDHYFGEE